MKLSLQRCRAKVIVGPGVRRVRAGRQERSPRHYSGGQVRDHVEHDDQDFLRARRRRLTSLLHLLPRGGEHELGPRVLQHVRDLGGGQCRIDRDVDHARTQTTIVDQRPPGAVFGKNGGTIAALDPELRQGGGHALHDAVRLVIADPGELGLRRQLLERGLVPVFVDRLEEEARQRHLGDRGVVGHVRWLRHVWLAVRPARLEWRGRYRDGGSATRCSTCPATDRWPAAASRRARFRAHSSDTPTQSRRTCEVPSRRARQ